MDEATLSSTDFQLERRTQAGKVWLTAGGTVVTEVGALPVRGFISETLLASRARWSKALPAEQQRLERDARQKHTPALAGALVVAQSAVAAYVSSCRGEGLALDLPQLARHWGSGVRNLDQCEAELRTLLTEQRALKRQGHLALQIAQSVKLADFPSMFEAAGRTRRLIAVLGPTNSGKTHDAFCRLAEASSGVYLGPLRLLALEAYSRLNREFGVKASLVTGEERRMVADSRVTASTIEMLDTSAEVEVAVIDEIQLLHDPDRGWAWTQAVVGANASEVWLLGAPSAEPAIRALAERLGLPLEIRYKQRKHPLQVGSALAVQPSRALKEARAGDAFIVFARRDALNLRDDLLAHKRTVACIYGALSPEVREREAERFASGEAEVLVATDAIGLGLNLPIQRVVFTAVAKFDGHARSVLTAALLQQIGGRAGRYGQKAARGVVAGITPVEHAFVAKLMGEKQQPLPSRGFPIAAGPAFLQTMTALTGETRLEALLSYFQLHADKGDGFYRAHVPEEQLRRAAELDSLPGLSLADKLTFSLAPIPVKSDTLDRIWRGWAQAASQSEAIKMSFLGGAPQWADLAEAEDAVRLLSAYRWFAYRMPEVFPELERATELLPVWTSVVDQHLKSRDRQGVGGGSCGQPSWYWGPPAA